MTRQLVHSPLTLDWNSGISNVAASLLSSLLKTNDPEECSEERSENVLRLGRRQLENLREEGHPYGEARVRALRQLLADGGGLPLLFPDHDVGFRYSGEGAAVFAGERTGPRPASVRSNLPPLRGGHERGDCSDCAVSCSHSRPSSSPSPLDTLRLGGRMPHFVLRPSWDENVDKAASRDLVPSLSTVDLPDQIRGMLLSRPDSKVPSGEHLGIFGSRVATGASRAEASLASVLIVSPLSSVAVHSGDRDRHDDSAVVSTVEAVSARWLSAAIAAQQPEGDDSRGAATAGEGAAGTDRRTPFRPLIVLTVSQLCRASIPAAAAITTTTTTTTAVVSSVKHLEAYLDHRSSIRTTPATSSAHVDAEVGAALAAEGPQQSDERLSLYAKRLGSKSSDVSDLASDGDGKRSDTRAAVLGGQVLSMHAIDDGAGRLGKAFAAAGTEAVLLRPDGHIAWLGLGLGCGSKLGSRGEGEDWSDCVLVQELRGALDTVYTMG